MTFSNPTSLRIGTEGLLLGTRYRVAGRVVLGVKEGGQTYYWQEFNLVSRSGETVTLVYEPTETGADWRLFTLFEPEYPLTAEDAATKQVGTPLNLDGNDVRVTLEETSRVYFIEGQAPEGVEVGDVAHYFNAEGGGHRIIVSWTGDEVECYRGQDLSAATVRSAFKLPPPKSGYGARLGPGQAPASRSTVWMTGLALFLGGVVGWAAWSVWRPKPANPAVKVSAPALPTALGRTWKVRGHEYSLVEHALVEIATVGSRFERHECKLQDAADPQRQVLLVCGTRPRSQDWVLYSPLRPAEPLTPQQAAAKRLDERVTLDGIVARVRELFLARIVQADSAESPEIKAEQVSYGLIAQGSTTELLVRWNAQGITCYQGTSLESKEVQSIGRFKP